VDQAELKSALERLSDQLAAGGGEIVELRRLSGGASQETWAFAVAADGHRRDLILRRRPESAMRDERTVGLAVEAAIIRQVAKGGVPVPGVVHVCTPHDGVGEAYIMTRSPGEALGRRIVRDAAFQAVRPGLARRCGEVLAAIHAVPLAELPALNAVSAIEEIAQYEAIYRGSGAASPTFEWALRQLKIKAPPPSSTVLLHGDFRNGNLLIDPSFGLTAVLDWELAHVGDPASDLGWLCVNSWRFGAWDKPVGGFGAYEALLDGYHAGGGREISLKQVRYWQMLGSLKWGIMCLIMYASYASGSDRSVERAMIGRRVSETEIDLVVLMEQGL